MNNKQRFSRIAPAKSLLEHLVYAKKFRNTHHYNYYKGHPRGYYTTIGQITRHLNCPDFTLQMGWRQHKTIKRPITKVTPFNEKLVRNVYAAYYAKLPPSETFTSVEAAASMGKKYISNTVNVLKKLREAGLLESVGLKNQISVGRKLIVFRRTADWHFQTIDKVYSLALKGEPNV
jgi:hypothetical protein